MSQKRRLNYSFLILNLIVVFPVLSLGNECSQLYGGEPIAEQSNVLYVDFRSRYKAPKSPSASQPIKNQEPDFFQDNKDYLTRVFEAITKTNGKDLTRNDVFVIQNNLSIILGNISNYTEQYAEPLRQEVSKIESLLEEYNLNIEFDPRQDKILETLPGSMRSDLSFLESQASLMALTMSQNLEGFSIFHLDFLNRYKNKQLRLNRIKIVEDFINVAIESLERAYEKTRSNPGHYDTEPILKAADSIEEHILHNAYFNMILKGFRNSIFAKYKEPA